MKREILCPTCSDNARLMFPTNQPYPQERVLFVRGTSKQSCVCDVCRARIDIDDHCTAFSIYSKTDKFAGCWEHEYVNSETPLPVIGGTYLHSKGQKYLVLSVIEFTEWPMFIVAYAAYGDDSGKIWGRPLELFMDGRFRLVSTGRKDV